MKKPLFLALLLLLFPLVGGAVTVTWDGDQNNGLWGDGGNWDTGSPPNSGDDVVIPGGLFTTYPNSIPSLVIQAGSNAWGSLTLGSSVTLEITGTVTIKTGTTFNLIGPGTFKAGAVTIEHDGVNPAVALNLSVNAALEATGAVTVASGALNLSGDGTIEAGTVAIQTGAALDLGDRTITVGNAVTSAGTITASGGSIVVTAGDFTQTGGSISAGGNITVTAAGNLTIGGGITSTAGTVTLSAGSGISLGADINAAAGNITFSAAVTLSGNAAVASSGGNIYFAGNLLVPQSRALTLDCQAVSIAGNVELYGALYAGPASSSSITITVGGNWIQTKSGFSDMANTGTFYPQAGTVIFTSGAVTIDGINTAWHNLEFSFAAGPAVKFRNYPAAAYDSVAALGHHIGGALTVAAGGKLTRLSPVAGDYADASGLPADPLDEAVLNNGQANKFWNLFYKANDFSSLGNNTEVDWCWIRPRVSGAIHLPVVDEWKRPQDPGYAASNARYNAGWNAPYVIYSFTEDWDHNGRIDHIRVQSYAPLDGDFSGLNVNIGGGYRVTGYSTPTVQTEYFFYITLEEKEHPDTDQRPPVQSISGNLYASGGPRILESARIPIDTAPPRIVSSLALPGGNELFIRTSEAVEFVPGAGNSITANGRTGAFTVTPAPGGTAGREFIIGNVPPMGAGLLSGGGKFAFGPAPAAGPGYFRDVPGTFQYPPKIGNETLTGCPLWWPKDREYGYGTPAGYIDAAQSWPPAWNPAGPPPPGLTAAIRAPNFNRRDPSSPDYGRRLTDLLIAAPPVNANSPFFVQPVYAHDFTGTAELNPLSRIFVFDGSKQLLDMDVTLQAKLNSPALPGFTGLRLYCASDKSIPAEFRSSGERDGLEGIWLPGLPPGSPAQGLIPRRYGDAYQADGDPSPGNDLYNFTIPHEALVSGGTLEFYFHPQGGVSSDLFVARLDTGNSAPWYRNVKPFSFRVGELKRQRSGVTILNNVINPNRGDRVILYYSLDQGGRVTAQVFTMDGTLIKVLEQSGKHAGDYALSWDGKNLGGRSVARGLYFIRIVAPGIDEIRKVMVVK